MVNYTHILYLYILYTSATFWAKLFCLDVYDSQQKKYIEIFGLENKYNRDAKMKKKKKYQKIYILIDQGKIGRGRINNIT